MRTIRVGSRKSKLALVQSGEVIDLFACAAPEYHFQVVHIVTKGDRQQHAVLSKIGGKGLFVKEIERALLDGTIDMAVHSMKDMPAALPGGLEIAAVPKREDPRDVLMSRNGAGLAQLPDAAVVGTGSLRRAAQILHVRPDLHVVPLRGNVGTRIARLKTGDFDAIILAAAGLKRLDIDETADYLPASTMLPAVGQGALAVECRSNDLELKRLLKQLSDEETVRTVLAERSFMKRLDGGCQVPLAAYCQLLKDGTLSLNGLVAHPDGSVLLRTEKKGSDPEVLGIQAAEDLLRKGAGDILSDFRRQDPERGDGC